MNPLIPGNPIWPGGILAPLGDLLFWFVLVWFVLMLGVVALLSYVDWLRSRSKD